MILTSRGIPAHVEQAGEGSPILLLHGWGPSSVTLEKHLRPLANRLKKNHQVTMVEFPGHGASGLPDENYEVSDYALYVLSIMDQLNIEQPVVIAHSFGGRVALWLAANEPQRVGPLVLTGCAGLRPKPNFKSWLRKTTFKLGRLSLNVMGLFPKLQPQKDKWLTALRKEFSSNDYLATPESLRGSFSRVVKKDLRPLLPKIRQQTLLVWGENDTATPLWMGRVMEKELQNARLLVYEADDHFAYKNQLSRFVTAVEVFLEEVEEA